MATVGSTSSGGSPAGGAGAAAVGAPAPGSVGRRRRSPTTTRTTHATTATAEAARPTSTHRCGCQVSEIRSGPPPAGGVTSQPLAPPSTKRGGAEVVAVEGGVPAGVEALAEHEPERPARPGHLDHPVGGVVGRDPHGRDRRRGRRAPRRPVPTKPTAPTAPTSGRPGRRRSADTALRTTCSPAVSVTGPSHGSMASGAPARAAAVSPRSRNGTDAPSMLRRSVEAAALERGRQDGRRVAGHAQLGDGGRQLHRLAGAAVDGGPGVDGGDGDGEAAAGHGRERHRHGRPACPARAAPAGRTGWVRPPAVMNRLVGTECRASVTICRSRWSTVRRLARVDADTAAPLAPPNAVCQVVVGSPSTAERPPAVSEPASTDVATASGGCWNTSAAARPASPVRDVRWARAGRR